MDTVYEGQIVRYYWSKQDMEELGGYGVGEARGAIVVRAWQTQQQAEIANLLVFLDGGNDDRKHQPPLSTMWRPSAHYSANGEPGTWHPVVVKSTIALSVSEQDRIVDTSVERVFEIFSEALERYMGRVE